MKIILIDNVTSIKLKITFIKTAMQNYIYKHHHNKNVFYRFQKERDRTIHMTTKITILNAKRRNKNGYHQVG